MKTKKVLAEAARRAMGSVVQAGGMAKSVLNLQFLQTNINLGKEIWSNECYGLTLHLSSNN